MTVWTPWSPFGPSDLLAETPAGRIFRLQVKSARLRAGCLLSNARSTDHRFVVTIEVAQECEIRRRVRRAEDYRLADWVARVCNGHTMPASVSATNA